jgi:hypothetical protein
MQILTKIRSFAVAVSSTAALALAVPAFAQHGVVVVARGGGYYGGYRVGYYGGYRGYYGYRRWYGGYYYPWGWGWGGLGLAPYYYSAYWYGGIPYYYANNAYFLPGSAMAQYGTIAPPAGRTYAVKTSCTARYACVIAQFVSACAPASEFAMAIRPNGWRPMTQGFCASDA